MKSHKKLTNSSIDLLLKIFLIANQSKKNLKRIHEILNCPYRRATNGLVMGNKRERERGRWRKFLTLRFFFHFFSPHFARRERKKKGWMKTDFRFILIACLVCLDVSLSFSHISMIVSRLLLLLLLLLLPASHTLVIPLSLSLSL